MRIPVLPGDGIGPVVIAEALRVVEATGLDADWAILPFGHGCWQRTGEALPAATEAAVREAGVALVGAATTPPEGCASPILALRRRLGLDLLVRPSTGPGLDLVVVGHAWEGLYGAEESIGFDDARRVPRTVTRDGVERLAAAAFAQAHRRITVVDKPTVFRHTATLFREAGARHARPDVAFEVVNADAFVADLLRRPGRYEVVVGLSFVADILSDLAAALAGGVPEAASASLGPGCAVFEPVHGTAPRRADEDPPRVSPVGAIRAGALLLDHLGEPARATRIRTAVDRVLAAGRIRTVDRGGTATTQGLATAVIDAL